LYICIVTKRKNNMNIVNVYIYRNSLGDCTNDGLSSKKDHLPLVVLDSNETEESAISSLTADGKNPNEYLVLVRRELWGENRDYIKPLTEKRWVMFGGNFAYSSDSRFSNFTGSHQPIQIHDRVEN